MNKIAGPPYFGRGFNSAEEERQAWMVFGHTTEPVEEPFDGNCRPVLVQFFKIAGPPYFGRGFNSAEEERQAWMVFGHTTEPVEEPFDGNCRPVLVQFFKLIKCE